MDQRKLKLLLFGILFMLVIAGCTVSGSSDSQQTLVTQTPNLTLTEFFRPTDAPKGAESTAPTETSAPEEPAPTEANAEEQATNTPVPPTPTTQTASNETPQETPAHSGQGLIPTQTLTPISFQGGQDEILIVIEYVDDPPNIDGDTGDWGGDIYALDKIVKGSEFFANERDLSGDFKIGWDLEYLYIGVTVRDTQFVQTAKGSQLSQGDGLEILLDTQREADINDDELSADDFQLGFSPGNLVEVSIPEGYMWAPVDREAPLTMAKVAGRLTGDGYMIEVAIAWEELGVTPVNDMTLGFLLSVSDNDFVSRVEQQSVLSFAPVRALSNPTTWAKAILVSP